MRARPTWRRQDRARELHLPGPDQRVSRAKYEAMRDALLAVLQEEAPGLKAPDAKAAQFGLEVPSMQVQLCLADPGR